MSDHFIGNIPSGGMPAAPVGQRAFLRAAAALAAVPVRVAADPARAAAELPDFPPEVALYRSGYRGWVGGFTADGLWACAPAGPDQVAGVVDWAWRKGWRVRARGSSYGWSPPAVAGAATDTRVLLVDTAPHLTGLAMESASAVRAGTGVTLAALLGFLEQHGLGLTAAPAPGDLTLGGALAIDTHGAAVPAVVEHPPPGTAYGSLSSRVLELTAVVRDGTAGGHVLRTFRRTDADRAAFLVHLGRSFVTEVVLRVGPDTGTRRAGRTDAPATAPVTGPGSGGRAAGGPARRAGKVGTVRFTAAVSPWPGPHSADPAGPSATTRHPDTPHVRSRASAVAPADMPDPARAP
ncbi:FAD-binding protein [Streptomyces sp. NPDC090108]|uniref:FAD-binding protein n=1 Tax=Streptomyces sp. NPDC090108 TaxID=3365947 RepID=UPI0037FDEE54